MSQERRERAEATASATNRDPRRFALAWARSVSQMPEDEMWTLLKGQYPRATTVRRRKAEHETATDHSVWVHGWRLFRHRGLSV